MSTARPSGSSSPIVAVTFDFWNTLVPIATSGTRAVRREAVATVLTGAGRDADPSVIEGALDAAVVAHTEAWEANRQFGAADGALAVADALGVTGALRVELVDAFVAAPVDLRPDLAPGVADTLRTLGAAGVRIGIVCDVGLTPSPTLRTYLDRNGVLDAFDHWSFSDEVGVYKPSAAIFAHALDGLGVDDPATALHLGDLRRTDIAGARGAGMVAVRYRGVADDPDPDGEGPEGHHVIDHHGEVLALVG